MPDRSRPYLAAAVQMLAGPDRAENHDVAESWIREAAARGAKLVALPELFFWRGPRADEPEVAEPIPGPTSAWLTQLARRLRLHIVGGSILERPSRGKRVYNTSLVAGPRGELLATYRKIHLFDVDLTGKVSIRESDTRRPGRELVTVPTPLGRLGLSVCYDLRFPELYRGLADRGAELLLVPAAFTHETGKAHWETLLKARAVENQCHLIAPDQVGRARDGMRCFGHSMIVDPWGRVLARVRSGTGLALAEIDPRVRAEVRRALPALGHRRIGPRTRASS